MNHQPTDGPPVHVLGFRKLMMVLCAIPIIVTFVVMLLHHKGLINIEEYGLPENYLYLGGFVVIIVSVVPLLCFWRCPGCGAYLGRESSPASCQSCGALFK